MRGTSDECTTAAAVVRRGGRGGVEELSSEQSIAHRLALANLGVVKHLRR